MSKALLVSVDYSVRVKNEFGVEMVEMKFENGITARLPAEYVTELNIPITVYGGPGGESGGMPCYLN